MTQLRDSIRKQLMKVVENYPAGAEHDSRAPWNEKEPQYSSPEGKEEPFKGLFKNNEITILKDLRDGSLWVYYDNLSKNDYKPYASYEIMDDSENEDFTVNLDVISRYVNDNLSTLDIGYGLLDYENGKTLVKIDSPLSNLIKNTYQEERLRNILLSLS